MIVNKNGHLRAIFVASASGRPSAQESKSPRHALKGHPSEVPAEDPGEFTGSSLRGQTQPTATARVPTSLFLGP